MTRFIWYSAAYMWKAAQWSLVLLAPVLLGFVAYFAFGGR